MVTNAGILLALYIRPDSAPSAGWPAIGPAELGDPNMRIILGLVATASLCLVAGCNRGGSNNAAAANAPAPAVNAPAPVDSAAPPAQTPAPASSGGARDPSSIQECIQDVQNELPSGTDLNAFCECAVAGMAQNGGRERPAMEQCAAQMGIQPR